MVGYTDFKNKPSVADKHGKRAMLLTWRKTMKFDIILKCNGMTIVNRRPSKGGNPARLIHALVKQREKFWKEPQKMLRLVAGGL